MAARNYLLPLTERERELIAGVGITDLDLSRRVNLAPVKEGWITLHLTRTELESLMWAACRADTDVCHAELRAAMIRMSRVLHGGPALPDPGAPAD